MDRFDLTGLSPRHRSIFEHGVRGGDGEPTTPTRPEVPESLDALSVEQLGELRQSLTAYRAHLETEARTPGIGVLRAREIADEWRQVTEQATAVTTVEAEAIGALNEITFAEPLPEPAVAPEAPAAEAAEPAAEPAPVEAEPVPVVAAITEAELAQVTDPASPPPPGGPAGHRPVTPLAVTAGLGAATVMDSDGGVDYEQLAVAFQSARGQVLQGNPAEKATARIAAIAGYDADPNTMGVERLSQSAVETDRMIREANAEWRARWDAARAPESRVAAICTPYEPLRDIPDCVQSTEPFSDSLPMRPAGRLGFTYTPSMGLSAISSGVDVWDETDQSNVVAGTVGTWKPCVQVTCPSPLSVTAEAITACMYFDRTTDMSNQERIRDAMSKIKAQKARTKTGRLLQIADTFSHHFEAATPYGALPGIVQVILTTLEQGEYPERLDDAPYVFYAPPGLLSALVIDRENQAYLDQSQRGEIAAYIEQSCSDAGKNVRVVDLDDIETAGQTPFASLPTAGTAGKVALPGLGGTTRPFKARLLAPESFLYFSTGEIETGVQTSPDLARRNQLQWFQEEYVGLAKHGCHPAYTLHLTVCPNGTRAALTTAFSCPTTAS